MRILEERKDYILEYDVYSTPIYKENKPLCVHKISVVVSVSLGTPTFYEIESKELKNLDKDLKYLSNKLIKRWKKEAKNAVYKKTK